MTLVVYGLVMSAIKGFWKTWMFSLSVTWTYMSVLFIVLTINPCTDTDIYFLIRYSALRAWAVKPSPRAIIEAVLPNSDAPSAEHIIKLERF